MLEPIQGEAGVWPATDQFLRDLRALTRAHGLLLIFDEIQTGMGRTGTLFHYEHAGIEPDIMTLGKGIGGGVPLAALLATEAASCFEHGDQGGTFNGNPLMCAAGLAVLQRVAAPEFLKSVVDAGLFLASELQRLSARHGLGEVRGRGLLLALDLKHPIGASIVAQALENGVLLNSPQPDALRFHARAQCHAGRGRGDDRKPGCDPDQNGRGKARGVTAARQPAVNAPRRVVPAKAGTHNHRRALLKTVLADFSAKLKLHGVWDPAFAGTTAITASRSMRRSWPGFRDRYGPWRHPSARRRG